MVSPTACVPTTEVAEVIFTEEARHMVAPFNLLDFGAAHGAEDDAVFPRTPAFKRPLHRCLTRRAVAVPVLSAAEADRVAALRAQHLLLVHVFRHHVSIAVWLGTEPHHWVTFE